MINTRFNWYLEKYGILDKSQCGFRKHRSTTDHLVSLKRYIRDAFAQKQQAVGLFFDLEKAYETTWQYGIIWDLHKIGLRGRLPVFVSEYLRDRPIRVRIGNTLSGEFYPEEGVPTGGVLAVTCFGLKVNELPSLIATDIFRALFVDDLAICFRGRSLDTIERHLQQAVTTIQEWATRNGFRFAAHKCKVVHCTASRYKAQRPPTIRISDTLLPVEESTKFLGLLWDSHLSFKEHISALKTQCKEALNLIRVVLQAIAVQVTLGGAPVTVLPVYTPGNNHLTTRDLSNLIRDIRGQILITGDFNGHNYMWGSHDVDTRGEIIERFTDKYKLCILNDGTHTYLKPQVQHVNRPTSAIDLTISTPGLALRSVWEVLADTHGSDHYPILTSILPPVAETQPSCDPSHWVFSMADWELFDELCLERINEDILEEGDPLQSFVEHITKAANDSISRATTIPKKSNPWFDEECREALKARRALDKRVRQSREFRGESLSAFRKSQVQARRLFNQKKRKSWAEYVSKLSADTPIKHVWDRVRKISGKNICPPKQYLNGRNGTTITNPKDIANKLATAFTENSSSTHYSATF